MIDRVTVETIIKTINRHLKKKDKENVRLKMVITNLVVAIDNFFKPRFISLKEERDIKLSGIDFRKATRLKT